MQKSSNKPQRSDEDLYCIVCLELPLMPVSCQACKKILCYRHRYMIENKCPNCRATPYAFNLQYLLKPRIDDLRTVIRAQEATSDKVFNCCIWSCKFAGKYSQMVEHRTKAHPKETLEILLYGHPEIQDPTEFEVTRADFIAHKNMKVAPAGEKKKSCQYQFALRMVRHSKKCENQGCHAVWAGPWGPFIGGKMGATHFDLTDCEEGKKMNVQIGWKYDDFRH